MSVAYVDTSVVVALAFAEKGADSLATKVAGYSRLVSSNLLEAELRAACGRERQPVPAHLLARISWILTHRPLSPEMETALDAGSLRGADLWHVASALYAAPEPGAIAFVTLDRQQARVAAALGFRDGESECGPSSETRRVESGSSPPSEIQPVTRLHHQHIPHGIVEQIPQVVDPVDAGFAGLAEPVLRPDDEQR